MKLVVALAMLPLSAAFLAAPMPRSSLAVRFAEEAAAEEPAPAPAAVAINGWTPDESKFAWGLPGNIDPAGDFDPFGYAEGASLATMKMYREAEVTHGRVAMVATLGFLVQEKVHFLFIDPDVDIGPAIRHLDQVREVSPAFFEILTFVIGCAELFRSLKGWKSPLDAAGGIKGAIANEADVKYTPGRLQEDYYPGDIGFDPFGLKPADAAEFAEMQTKELQNGRVAMIAAAGFIAQELVNEQPIFPLQF